MSRFPPESFFPCRVYNDDLKLSNFPVYAFLSQEPGYDFKAVQHRIQTAPPATVFLLINGQQLPPLMEREEERDRILGRRLTGVHHVYDNGIWKQQYRIFNTASPFPSAAARIWETFAERGLVMDVLDPRYTWEEFPRENDKAYDNLYTLVLRLIKAFDRGERPRPDFFLAGFSRGGMIALKLAAKLKDLVNIRAVVTLDPVIARWKEGDGLVRGWGVKTPQGWGLQWQNQLQGLHLYQDIFPILRSPGVPCFNVFQRKSFFAMNSILDKPIGAAVAEAKAPFPPEAWKHSPVAELSPADQYDESVDRHSLMVDKYADWVVHLAQSLC